ncbi:MAG: hypothetical protein DMF93_23715 [Acidobacteria bacterium]|nr:MAG: hypothetical protein DMF93_23715 [Acidobacteriota bacterium]
MLQLQVFDSSLYFTASLAEPAQSAWRHAFTSRFADLLFQTTGVLAFTLLVDFANRQKTQLQIG